MNRHLPAISAHSSFNRARGCLGLRLFALGALCCAASLSASAATPLPAPPALKVLINAGDQGEQSRAMTMMVWRSAVEQALRKGRYIDPILLESKDMAEDLGATRARVPDIVVGPAHLIGSAVRYGYVPIAALETHSQAVLVTLPDSSIGSFAQAKGTRLGLTQQDSLVTYLLRGETVAANTTIKRHFKDIYTSRYQDALLVCLQMKRCDVVGVERATADRWIAGGTAVKVILETQTAPGMGVAVKDAAKLPSEALRADIAEAMQTQPVGSGATPSKLASVAAADYIYVSTLGYFTPRTLAGATVVNAQTVAQMLAAGKARYIDTRNDAEFNEGHVPGATLVAYVEKSAKDPDYDVAVDSFNIGALGSDRSAEFIFGCNGPECWKSHKASIAAIKAGFTHVYWFRGGVPEWRQSGMKIETGAASVASAK